MTRRGVALVAAAVLAWLAPRGAQAGLGAWTAAGPEGGGILALGVDPQTLGVIYAGAQVGGAFKTSTGGSFWTPISNGLTSAQIHTLSLDPKTTGVVYAGTVLGGAFKTTNGGASWAAINNGLPFPSGDQIIESSAIDPKTTSTLYVGLASGQVFKSTDAGASWGQSLFFSPSAQVLALAVNPVTPTTVYAGTGIGVFKTTDAGSSWTYMSSGMSNVSIQSLAIDSQAPDTIYAATVGGGVNKSTNGGVSWSPTNNGLTELFLKSVTVDPQTPLIVYAGTSTSGVFKSTNGGASWVQISAGLPPTPEGYVIKVDPFSSATLYVGIYGRGVFKSTNGGSSWSPSNASLGAAFIFGLASDPQNPATLYSGGAVTGMFKSTSGGTSWTPINNGNPGRTVNVIAVSPSAPSTVYAGTSFASVFFNLLGGPPGAGGVFKSTDGGASWSRTLSTDFSVQALAVDPTTPLIAYAGTLGDGVFKTTNGGASWSQVNMGLADSSIFALAIHPAAPNVVYAGTGASFGGRVFKTTNGGPTWSDTGLTSSLATVLALAFDPQVPSTLYAGSWGDGAFKTTDAGLSWTRINSGLFNQTPGGLAVFALAVDPRVPATVYAGTFDTGVFRSTNGGASWTQFSPGLPASATVHALAINAAGTCLHAATGSSVHDFATRFTGECLPPPPLVADFSTTSQSVEIGTTVQTLATVENLSGTTGGVTCGVTQLTGAPTPLTFQAVGPTTDQQIAPRAVAPINTPVDIAAGSSQKFLITLKPLGPLCPLDIQFGFNCTNSELAPIQTGVNTLLLTAGPAGGDLCGLSASASASQSTFTVGQTLIAGGSVTNPGLPGTAADFYVGILRPDNSIQFLTSTGIVLGNVADLGSFRPIATNVSLAAPFAVSQPNVFTRQWTAADVRGRYVFFVVAVKTGALAGGTISNSDILRLATATYSFP